MIVFDVSRLTRYSESFVLPIPHLENEMLLPFEKIPGLLGQRAL